MEILQEVPPRLPKNAWVSLDLELFQSNKKILHRPTTGKFACLSVCYNPETVYIVTSEKLVPQVITNLSEAIWIFHNAKFDLTHLRRWACIPPRKRLYDTMIIDRILWGGYFNTFALEDLARRYLDVYLDKSLQSSFEESDVLSEGQLEYAAKDASITLQISTEQKKYITEKDWKIWTEIDRPALWAIMDFQGFRLNVEAWQTLAKLNKIRSEELDEQFPFNPRSPKQVKQFLSKNGFPRLPDTQERTLSKFIAKYPETEAAKVAQGILDSRKFAKRHTTYGMNFIENYLEVDLIHNVEVIHTNYWVIGTETGRMSSSEPNLQNIPVKDTNEFRKCFIARPNNKLVIVDNGQQELRIAAYRSQDKKLIEVLNDRTSDVFVNMAEIIYNKKIEKSNLLRKKTKNFIYGLNYGMSAEGFAERSGLELEEAENIMEIFFSKFPDLANYLHSQSKQNGCVETVMGRRAYLNHYSGQAERNAINDPIQGTAADQLKMAVAVIHKDWSFDYPFALVAAIHDELIADVPTKIAKDVADFMEDKMVKVAEVMCPGVLFTAEAVIGDSWAAKE